MVRVTVRYRPTPHGRISVSRCLFSSNNFATSAALAEVCALLSVIPAVYYAGRIPSTRRTTLGDRAFPSFQWLPHVRGTVCRHPSGMRRR